MSKNLITALLLFIFGLAPLAAQSSGDSLTFSLQQAMDYASENAFQSKSATYDIEAAEKRVWEYIAIGLPQVNAEGQVTNNLSIQENVITMTPDDGSEPIRLKTQFGQQYNWNATGNVSQLIFDGSYLLGIKASRIYVDISEKNKTKTQIDVRQSVAEAYYVALVARKNLETFKKNLEVNQQTLKETEAYFNNGFREMTDVDQLKLMVNNSRNLVLDAERQLTIAEAVLKYSMGLSIEQPIKLSDDIDFLLTPVEAYSPQSNGFDVKTHIDYSILETQEDAQKTIIKNEQVQYLPKINAFYNISYIEFGDEFSNMENTNSQMLGLSLSMPIFTSGMRHAKVKQEKINYLKLQNDMRQMEEGLKQQLMVAESNFKNAKATYLNDKEGEAIAFRIYDRTRIKFTKGLASSTELSQNEGQFIQSQINYIQSTLNLLDTHIKYQKAINQL
ncbi:TolC family protein [Carboxylicivirga mesophila]|uniref:TolC family protein n=1 Tax=Carboxylicivirga mesophila TaxID=1166478 RepID=A0ABS5K6F5_9BACT|nr:TolC family protein [Carboxylicivirga mesophila]MBS2210091.1 TolC family protein [Carboxylicivirga mesophila]